jgi:hypothetical protein
MSGERWFAEELHGAASAKGFGGALAELFGCDALRSVLDDVGDLITVGADDHRVQMPDIGFHSLSIA